MAEIGSREVTQLLADMRRGSDTAAHRLLPAVYGELKAIAAEMFRDQPADHTLNATALVHEAFLRLVHAPAGDFNNRAHFFAVAAKAMRTHLIDHARKREAKKRGSGWDRITLSGLSDALQGRPLDFLALDEALTRLSHLHARQAQVVEMRFFGGLSIAEAAEVLNVSDATVKNDWAMARAWLACELSHATRS